MWCLHVRGFLQWCQTHSSDLHQDKLRHLTSVPHLCILALFFLSELTLTVCTCSQTGKVSIMMNPNRARARLPSGNCFLWNQNGPARQVDGVHVPLLTARETPYVAWGGGAPPLRGALPASVAWAVLCFMGAWTTHKGFWQKGSWIICDSAMLMN